MTGDVVPFGKYKGQPVEALAADREYCEWLLAQPWFANRYGNVYNILISYGGEPQDSPEHNEMQARFLEDDWCLNLAVAIAPQLEGGYGMAAARKEVNASLVAREFRSCLTLKERAARVECRDFEHGGWDVYFDVAPARVTVQVTSLAPLPACTCRCDHGACEAASTCSGGQGQGWCRHRYHEQERRNQPFGEFAHCTDGCPWAHRGAMRELCPEGNCGTTKADWLRGVAAYGLAYGLGYIEPFYIELKPDLGDDYPAVLRQVNGYRARGAHRCVVARRYAFASVTWNQVKKIFAASGVVLIAEGDIDPEKRVLALLESELGGEVVSE